MRKHRCYLVDDEELSISALKRMLDESGRVDVMGLSTDPLVATEDIRRFEPDLLFLDIRMPEIDGFELLSRLPWHPFVIFTTAYDQHAVRAFETNAIDYLLKPVERERLLRSLDRLETRRSDGAWQAAPYLDQVALRVTDLLKPRNWLRRVAIQGKEGVSLLDLDRVTHFVSENRYSYACTENGRFPVSLSLGELEVRLDPAHFLRIHRATIVNLDFIEHLSTWFAGRLYIRLRDRSRSELTVGRDRVAKLRQALGLQTSI